jgi:hypothetical protein
MPQPGHPVLQHSMIEGDQYADRLRNFVGRYVQHLFSSHDGPVDAQRLQRLLEFMQKLQTPPS